MPLFSYSIVAERKTLLRCTHYYDLISLHSVSYDDAFNLLVEPLHAVPKSGRCGLRDGDGNQDGFRHLRLKWKRGKGTMLLQKCVYVSTNIPAVGETSLLCNPVRTTPTHAEPTHTQSLQSLHCQKSNILPG